MMRVAQLQRGFKRGLLPSLFVASFCSAMPLSLAAQSIERQPFASPESEQSALRKFALILVGPTVGEENQAKYKQLSLSLHDVLTRDYGYSAETVELLAADSDDSRVDGVTDSAGIEAAVARSQAVMKRGEQLAVFLLGHGTGIEDAAKFNIRGPDMTGVTFAKLFDGFVEQDLVFVNTTSASYGFSTALAREVKGEGRIVISATRSSAEKFDPLFPRYFIEGLSQKRADRDKNSRVSLLEAFDYAKNNVDAFYDEQGRLASEHAGLDDNGDALFALAPVPGDDDGGLAEIAFIDGFVETDANLTSAQRTLKRRMHSLERAVLVLRGRKADTLEDDYWDQLEDLLVDLSRTTEEFNANVMP